MPNLEQERAAYAWGCVQERDICTTDYVKLSKSAPALVMGNGLMQTLAFFKSKNKDHHNNLNLHIMNWLAQRFLGRQTTDFHQIMNFLHGKDSSVYRLATEETMELLRWIRQFAAAVNDSGE
ncbi:MAG: type III-B CRISPR module-associated protein Cmr5 [Desulfurivibrio sp.]|nr:MAG: type III-B CRISPR module-associated protein Cmr5 [Desulfurivibrio sp.]